MADLAARLPHVDGAGSRGLLQVPGMVDLGHALRRHPRLAPLLTGAPQGVQCILFDKSTASNWAVAAHQDVCIPVASPVESPGWRTPTIKEGVWHQQPPDAVLSGLVIVRVQVDPTPNADGALEVIPESHRQGRSTAERIAQSAMEGPWQSCGLDAGDALVMRPLLLHRSSRLTVAGRRRVLHFVFGPARLPDGACWPAGLPGDGLVSAA